MKKILVLFLALTLMVSNCSILPVYASAVDNESNTEQQEEMYEGAAGETSENDEKLWLSGARFEAGAAGSTYVSVLDFDPSVKDYTVEIANTAAGRRIWLTPTEEAVENNIYYQFLLDGEPTTKVQDDSIIYPTKFESTAEINVSAKSFNMQKIPIGTTHEVKLLVGPLAEGAEHLSEADCNVYTFTIKRVLGFADIAVKDLASGSMVTLDPAFQVQIDNYNVEVTGTEISIKTQWVNPTVTYVGNNTEPASGGGANYAWTTVELADYTAEGSDTAIIPVKAVYSKDDVYLERTATLNVKWQKEEETIQNMKLSSALHEETYTLSPEFSKEGTDYSTKVTSTLLRLDIECTEDTVLSMPQNEVFLGTNTNRYTYINLNNYQADESGNIAVPLKVSSGNDSTEKIITLSLACDSLVPGILSKSDDVECNKGDTKEISVQHNSGSSDGSIAYQWYWNRGQTTPQNFVETYKIDNATDASFAPPTTEAHSNIWYCCKVTYTDVDGKVYDSLSGYIHFVVKLSYVNSPCITSQPGAALLNQSWEIVEGTYDTEYYTGETCDPIYVGLEEGETGTERSVCWYYNTSNSNQDGTLIDSTFYRSGKGYYGYKLNKAFDVGTYYIYCVIRDTDTSDSNNYAETVSETCKFIFKPLATTDYEGEGTEDNPYLLKTQEDLLTLQKRVNEDGVSYAGVFFWMVNDITLPDGWTPIGCTKDGSSNIQNGANLNAFSGTIDGAKDRNDLSKGYNTLSVPAGGLPLLAFVNGATVKNLNIYGSQIAGAGLVNNYTGVGLSGTAIVIDHVTLKAGTSTLKSGLITQYGGNGYASASAAFTVTIKDCTIEEGVTIGYDKEQSNIGSIAGNINGTIENCISYANVYGVNYVGGILGGRDNALGTCQVKNCTFAGSVMASGSCAGGIVGGGYGNSTAPNGARPTIESCKVAGTVEGNKYVGGIFGGDRYVAQTWLNVAGSISNNEFTGKVSGNQYVGAIIGYLDSLNRYDTISGNIYSAGCGAAGGIGFVNYLDTSYEDPVKMDGTTVFNTENGVTDCPSVTWCSWQANHNRTDDPLGKDADALCKAIRSLGDLNGDGQLTNADVAQLLASVTEGASEELSVADLNGDGIITNADVAQLLSMITAA